jgi:WD40 repeat protein
VALSPDGRLLAFHGPKQGWISLWDAEERETPTRLARIGPKEYVAALAWSRRNELALIVEGRLLVWDFQEWK